MKSAGEDGGEAGRAALLEQGWRRHRAGDHQAAAAIAKRLLEAQEATPEVLLFAGEVEFSRGNFVGTDRLASRCVAAFPDDVNGLVLKCRALMALGRLGEARDLALALAEREIEAEAHVDILVTVLSGLMEPAAAYPLCRRSVERDPYNAAAHRRLALTCRLIGRFDEAAEAASVALRFDPHDYEMIGLRSAVDRATPEKNHVAELEDLMQAGCRSALGAARVAYALAKENEELGNYERAFRFLEAGARFKRQTFRYDIDRDLEMLAAIERTFTASSFDDLPPGCASDEPIFILGLPRTGSTLLERILSSHTKIHAAGELLHFNAAMAAELRRLGATADTADQLAKIVEADAAAIGRGYLERTRPFTGHTPHFIDKRPLNYLLIGVIHRALPNARIIHVRRTPMDACYAIYKFLFNEAYPWSYDLDDIARYYIAYRRLMDHWRAVLPGRIVDVAYEDVVGDLEGQARRLVARLGLDWEPACLDFHINESAAMTGSAVQVRQKIYSSSVGRWRDYERQLESVAFAIESAGFDPYKP